MSKVIGTTTLCKGNFLQLDCVRYEDDNGKVSTWEACQRVGGKEAVTVIPCYYDDKHQLHLILVKQFRPAVGAYCIEFPAGIIDEGETPEQAAVRELKEETGYSPLDDTQHSVYSYGSGAFSIPSPGLTGEHGYVVYIRVNWEQGTQELKDNESIEVIDYVPGRGDGWSDADLSSKGVLGSQLKMFLFGLYWGSWLPEFSPFKDKQA